MLLLSCLILIPVTYASNDLYDQMPTTVIHKCCEEEEIIFDGATLTCRHVNFTSSTPWFPTFSDDEGNDQSKGIKRYEIVTGFPNCGTRQQWPVYNYGTDRLMLSPKGILRHFIHYQPPSFDYEEEGKENAKPNYLDHYPGNYCLDKVLLTSTHDAAKMMGVSAANETDMAVICAPNVYREWTYDLIIRQIIDPILHVIGIGCLLTVAIVYFVLPPLRDLIGNILSSIALCLIISLAADLVRIFTQFSSHVSFMIADIIMYLSTLAAFFWLNSFGYYIWKTFRSRNVFLRVSDGRKYCYYSFYVWGCTFAFALLAIIAHFLFDIDKKLPVTPHGEETIGWLGISMFFTPIAFIVLINIFFCLTTANVITRMSVYGRIHGRMKYNFQLFVQIFIVMTLTWFFLLLSWLQFEFLIMVHIWAQALQSILILFICVGGQRSVRDLLKKGCCRGNQPETHWGEEMMAMTM